MEFWDGSYLECSLIKTKIVDGIRYGMIKEYNMPCLYIQKKNLLPVIIDEMKPIFGLSKVGSRYNKSHIFFSPYIEDGKWCEETRLNKKDDLSYFNKREVRKILSFRYLLGLTNIQERSILVRDKRLYDFFDISFHPVDDKIVLTLRILNDWFNEININRSISILLKFFNITDSIELIIHIRKEILEIIERIDKSYIFLTSLIADRISDALDKNV